ncbi:unnamed protein product [Moneuplotes crassus]|uniref:Uncharacterized protein n=1 Tax=Euplotes crassus TaxID=5936 RepID=A0AAD1UKP7_EUPCR|nr:unnamed protein product [Moneuplotes crassus]
MTDLELPVPNFEETKFAQPSTGDLINHLTDRPSPRKPKPKPKKPAKLDVYKLLPKDMYSYYEKKGLPDAPAKLDQYLKDVYFTLNLCRQDPIFFVNNFLEPMRGRYSKSNYYKDFMNNSKFTVEGISETDEIIDKLSAKNVPKTSPLEWNASLCELCEALIGTLEIENYNTIKSGGVYECDISRHGINPTSKVYDYIEVGSQIGFEALSRITFYDHENKISIRDENWK